MISVFTFIAGLASAYIGSGADIYYSRDFTNFGMREGNELFDHDDAVDGDGNINVLSNAIWSAVLIGAISIPFALLFGELAHWICGGICFGIGAFRLSTALRNRTQKRKKREEMNRILDLIKADPEHAASYLGSLDSFQSKVAFYKPFLWINEPMNGVADAGRVIGLLLPRLIELARTRNFPHG